MSYVHKASNKCLMHRNIIMYFNDNLEAASLLKKKIFFCLYLASYRALNNYLSLVWTLQSELRFSKDFSISYSPPNSLALMVSKTEVHSQSQNIL